MAEEQKDQVEQTEGEESKDAKPKSAKSPMMTYIIFGGAGLGLMVVIIFVTLFFLGGDKPEAEYAEETATTEQADAGAGHSTNATAGSQESTDQHATKSKKDAPEEVYDIEEDAAAIDQIMENLAFLDYEPDDGDLGIEDEGMSVEDSIEAMNWLEKEKAALVEREKTVNDRFNELEKIDRDVTKKLNRLDQAQSSRVANLARLYDGMDPRSVAKLMHNLDDGTVVSLLPRMKNKNASNVLALLPAVRAARLSKQMITISDK